MNNEDGIAKLERKIRSVGTQFKWWGMAVMAASLIWVYQTSNLTMMTVLGTALGLGTVMSLQGIIIENIFKQKKTKEE